MSKQEGRNQWSATRRFERELARTVHSLQVSTKQSFRLVVLALALFASGCGDEDGRELSLEFRPQETQVWCWAAATEMVLDYYRRNVSQCELVSRVLGMNCCTGAPQCVNRPGSVEEMTGLMSGYGLRGLRSPGALSFGQVKDEIDAGRPIIAIYHSSFIGHVVVIYGYREKSGGLMGALGVSEAFSDLLIYDPYYGDFTVPYHQTFQYANRAVWGESLHGIEVRPPSGDGVRLSVSNDDNW